MNVYNTAKESSSFQQPVQWLCGENIHTSEKKILIKGRMSILVFNM